MHSHEGSYYAFLSFLGVRTVLLLKPAMFFNLKCHVRLLSMLNIGGEEFETRKVARPKKEKAN
jgi:hypothetical protein